MYLLTPLVSSYTLNTCKKKQKTLADYLLRLARALLVSLTKQFIFQGRAFAWNGLDATHDLDPCYDEADNGR